jgi:DNA-binding NarL/FixJ family response regulator
MTKRLVLIDNHVAVRQMLAVVLLGEAGYQIAGEAASGLEGLALCRQCRPDVAIVDLLLPGLCGSELARLLREEKSHTRVLIFTGVIDRERLLRAIQCKPHGFIEKSAPLAVLREGIRVLANGGRYFTRFASDLLEASDGNAECQQHLTEREVEVVQMVAESCSSKEIATRLGIAAKTVEHYRANIMQKLGARDVAALTRYAVKRGLVG